MSATTTAVPNAPDAQRPAGPLGAARGGATYGALGLPLAFVALRRKDHHVLVCAFYS